MRLALAISLPVFSTIAQTNNPSHGGPGGRNHGQRPPPMPIVMALDVNHDGIISADEIAAASAALKTLDKNGDGQLTKDEYLPPRPEGMGGGRGPGQGGGPDDGQGPPPGMGRGHHGTNDNDGPPGSEDNGPGPGQGQGGKGGQGGHKRPLPPIVKALDANGDGIISADEIANAPAALKTLDKNGDGQLTHDEYMPQRPQGMGGGRGPGGPDDGQGPPPGMDGGAGGPPDGQGPPPQQN